MKIFTVISTVIALFFAINTTFAQEKITVSGNVTDQHGDVMIGCSVIEKHSTTGTITDFDGNYSIETETGKTLVFSYIGYKNQEIEVTNAKIDVVLEEDLLLLDNDFLIYCCFPTTKAKPFEIQSLNDEKIFQKSPTDFTKAMLGEFAGLQVINSSGQTGIPSDIYIRGINSLYASTAPVFVLDGMVYKGDIAAINPADIYSISVRKNVLDMSYFGLQASNGIVEIITKKGVSYKPKFNIDVKFGLNFAPQRYETIIDPKTYTELGWQGIYTAAFMNGQNHEQAANFANQNLFSGYGVSPQYNPFETDGKNLINPVTGKMFDDVKYKYVPEKWTDYLLHTGKRYEANASLAGGSKIVDYYASFGFLKDNGYFQKADYQRISTLANFNFHPAKWINIDLNVAYTNSTMNNPLQGYYGTNKGFVFINGIPPIYPVFKHDADGAKTDEYDYGDEYYRGFGTGINPVAELQTNKSKTTAHNLVVNSAVKFLLPKGFSIILNNGFVINKSIFNKNIVVFYEISDEMQTNCNNAIYQQTVKYEKNLGYLHNVDIAAGQELSRIYLSEKSIKNSNSPMQDFNFNSSNQMTERIFAYAKYNFNTKYFFEATTSFDRNSDLTTENKMFNSWAVGGAWLIGNEHFMRNIKNWLNELKLNISYGATGNVVKKNDNKYYIKPEKSEIFNAGVSFGIKHFLNVNVDIYN
ncbi:MAG: carboxypeptidase-like regulatory domain-containing protein, partial [Prevotellaceae bacterium]|nr:carboxypeptidase-like regulatory domain-containing protein [Prevotellaceae bacterium]